MGVAAFTEETLSGVSRGGAWKWEQVEDEALVVEMVLKPNAIYSPSLSPASNRLYVFVCSLFMSNFCL